MATVEQEQKADIVDRLRDVCETERKIGRLFMANVLNESANEIVRLRQHVSRLEDHVYYAGQDDVPGWFYWFIGVMVFIGGATTIAAVLDLVFG